MNRLVILWDGIRVDAKLLEQRRFVFPFRRGPMNRLVILWPRGRVRNKHCPGVWVWSIGSQVGVARVGLLLLLAVIAIVKLLKVLGLGVKLLRLVSLPVLASIVAPLVVLLTTRAPISHPVSPLKPHLHQALL